MLRNAGMMVGASLVIGALGCKHEGESAGPRTPAAQSRSAVREIAEARCDREERCENIGGGDRKYATRDLCEQSVTNDWADDLNEFECRSGVVDAELEECLAAVREEDCGSVLDALDRFTSCSAADICAD
jgi:hypothetical protein